MTHSFLLAGRASRPLRAAAIALAALAIALRSSDARAEPNAAEALFQEGKALMAQRRFAEACPKLAESQRIDPSGGTILHLALCHKEEGRIATAYKELEQAVLFAKRDGRADRERAAKALSAELYPRLPTLTIRVSPEAAAIDGLSVKRDGVLVPPSAFGAPFAVDPGAHTVTAWAPGRAPFLATIDLRGDGAAERVLVPGLDVDPAGKDAGASAGRPDRPGDNSNELNRNTTSVSAKRKVGFVVAGLGAASLGVGAVFGLRAAATKGESAPHCDGVYCDDEGIRVRASGLTQASIATGTFIAGGALAALGLALVITGGASAPPGRPASAAALSIGPSGALIRGYF